ncbi:MAG: hypothetical protein IKT28_05670, partial [Rikenellaceae bacterium]|nr:hypothetical protein [Rikenellaceae bacterium]
GAVANETPTIATRLNRAVKIVFFIAKKLIDLYHKYSNKQSNFQILSNKFSENFSNLRYNAI